MSEHTPLTEAEVSPAIKAQNPDLETAWRKIAWWEQTCDYWHAEAQKGYALRDSLAARTSTATADTGLRERVEALAEECEREEKWLVRWYSPDSCIGENVAMRLRDLLDGAAAPVTDTGARQ